MRPVEFIREMFCLDSHYRPYRGAAARERKCPKVGPLPDLGVGLSPVHLARGPQLEPVRDDAPIGELGAGTRTIEASPAGASCPGARRCGSRSSAIRPTRPIQRQSRSGARPAYMDLSEWLAFRNGAVASYSQYTLVDDLRARPAPVHAIDWQSGLRFATAGQAGRLLRVPRCPFSCARSAAMPSRCSAAGAPTPAVATIESKAPGGRYRSLGPLRVNSAGYFRRILPCEGRLPPHLPGHDGRHGLASRSRVARPTPKSHRNSSPKERSPLETACLFDPVRAVHRHSR